MQLSPIRPGFPPRPTTCPHTVLPAPGIRAATRALIDRVCAGAPAHLRPGGFLLLVQGSFCDVPATVELLTTHELNVNIVARRAAPVTVLDERARELQQHGPRATNDSTFESVVIRASQPPPDECTAVP